MCLVHLTLLAGARRQERPLPKLVKAFVNKRHQYFGLEPMHTSYEYSRHCCKVSDEAAFCLIQRPYISKTLLTRRISPRGSP